MTVGDRIRLTREQKDMTQDDVAKKLGLKDKSSVSKIEASGDGISTKSIKKYAEVLGVTPAYLMGWEDEQSKPIVDQIEKSGEEAGRLLAKITMLSPRDRAIIENTIDAMLNAYE